MNKYYLAVPVGERLPTKANGYLVLTNEGRSYKTDFNKVYKNGWDRLPVMQSDYITHWLEPTSGVLLQTEELEGYKNKMECLLGYLEAWLINKPLPHELELVVKEADEFLSSLTSKSEVK